MPPINITSVAIAAIAGAILSLIFSYIPGLNTRFAALTKETQQLSMAGLMLLTTIAVMALGCYKVIQIDLTCDQNGIVQAVYIFITAIMGNQSIYKLTPQPKAVQALKK
jgi:hypothetical protein